MPLSNADRSTPAALRLAWIAAVHAGDAEALRPLLAPDYEVWAHGAPALSGPDATIAAIAGALARYHIDQCFELLETVIIDDWAFERGIESMTVTPREAGAPRTMKQRAVLMLRRDADGHWQYARGITNGLPSEDATSPSAREA